MKKETFSISLGKQLSGILIALICIILFSGEKNACFAKEKKSPSISAKFLFDIKTDDLPAGKLNQPAGIDVGEDGKIFVADTINDRIIVFNETGAVVTVFGKSGSGAGELKAPMALTVDQKSNLVYVADSSNYRVQVFKTDGSFVSTIVLEDYNKEEEKKIRPIGIATNEESEIFISDADNNLIRAYSSEGTPLFKFGGFGKKDGELCIPVGLSVDKKNNIYVVDMSNARVQVFDRLGKFLFKFGELGDSKGYFSKPKDVGIGKDGTIFVTDGASLVVQIFDKKGNFIDVIGSEENVDLQFASPFGLATSNNRLYISDRWRNTIRVYEVN